MTVTNNRIAGNESSETMMDPVLLGIRSEEVMHM
eukprot:CAMPEP_0194067314 /NCGR_PEP_ID=MMETSP0009_2-20130614/86492_1 /TAXON_ID=210454 /ORGANISM="Grammatophora oceanica, Strain CCMP 410" /LENGTH=33 /DNA_ID= /DNA_START= /DNA_END= /DNA_ORIENTATION=